MSKYAAICILIVACVISHTSALECYRCSHNNFNSDNSALSFVLQTLSKISNQRCLMQLEQDKYELDVRRCPEPRPGHVYKCGEITGEVNFKVDTPLGDVEVIYQATDRDCIEVPDDDSDFSDGCHDAAGPMPEPVRNLVSETFDGLEGSEVSFTGQACYESKGVQIPSEAGPLCPRCTHTVLSTDDDGILDWFIRTIQTINDDHCKLEDYEDQQEINYRVCPPAPYGEFAKCGKIDGKITGRVGFLNLNFAITSLQRDCVNGFVAEARNAMPFSNGCHQTSGSTENNPIIAPLVAESVNYEDVSNPNFQGQACFQSQFEFLTAGSVSNQMNFAMVMMLLLSALMAVYLHL